MHHKHYSFVAIVIVAILTGCGSKQEPVPKVAATPTPPNPDLLWPVKFDVSKWDVASVHDAVLFILNGQQSKNDYFKAQDIEIKSDSLFDAKFHADQKWGYSFRVRITQETGPLSLVISTPYSDSDRGTTAANSWGNDILKKLKKKSLQ